MTNPNQRALGPMEPQFPYVEECDMCAGYGCKSLSWFIHRVYDFCVECKGKGYVIPQEWIEGEEENDN